MQNIRRSENTPLVAIVYLHSTQSLTPAEHAFFARVDLLSTTNQAEPAP
jgi:hypothetical protein